MTSPALPKREPNRTLKRRRQELRSRSRPHEPLSRPELADMVNRELAAMGIEHQDVDGNYVGKLEQGKIAFPREESRRRAFRQALQVSRDEDLGFFPYRRSVIDRTLTVGDNDFDLEEEEGSSGSAIRAKVSEEEDLAKTGACDGVPEDQCGVGTGTLHWCAAGMDLVEFASALDQHGIGSAELTAIELATERLDQEFARLPPDEVLEKTRMLMKRVGAGLREPQTLRHHERLVRLGARLAGLRGWACFDVDDHDGADRWYEIAVDAAQDAKAWGLGAWLLGAQSLIPWHRRDLPRTIDLIERGIYFAGHGSDATTRAWLYALHARGCAGTGDRDGFDTAYALAQEAAEYSTERDRHHGMDFADGTLDLRYYSGTSRLLLREPGRAHSELSGSLAALPESHTKARAILTLFLADAAVQSGDATRAMNLTQQAIASTMHQPIVPILQQSRRIRRLVQQRNPAAADELNDPIHQFGQALTALTSKTRS